MLGLHMLVSKIVMIYVLTPLGCLTLQSACHHLIFEHMQESTFSIISHGIDPWWLGVPRRRQLWIRHGHARVKIHDGWMRADSPCAVGRPPTGQPGVADGPWHSGQRMASSIAVSEHDGPVQVATAVWAVGSSPQPTIVFLEF